MSYYNVIVMDLCRYRSIVIVLGVLLRRGGVEGEVIKNPDRACPNSLGWGGLCCFGFS